MEKFKNLGLSETTLEALRQKGFEQPTPIQEATIPLLLKGEVDVIGQAQTGTGKTAAFGLPIIELLSEKAKDVQAIILTPTRELALQVAEELESFKGKKKISILPVYGGASMETQLRQLKKGVDIVVGTPGRVIDHLERGTLELKHLTFFVLDEADEMLNMGFLEDIEKILEQTNPDKRMLFFSATMPEPILDIAKKFMRKYEIIRTTPKQLTTHLVEQYYYEVPIKYKFEALCRIIDIEVDFYGLVFCKTKSDVDEVVSLLAERGYNAEALHGDISQHQREKILDKFKKKLVTILVATDVAARGIDIQNLTHVVNYSLPQDPESYVHRIGRTGRAGRTGIAISLVPPADIYKLQQIKRIAKVDIQQRRIPSGKDVVEAKKAKIRTEVSELVKANGFQDYKNAAEEILKEIPAVDALAAMLKYAFRNDLNEHAYADINPTKASKNKTERDRRGGDSIKEFFRTEEKGRKKSVRLFVALGKKDGVTPRKLVEFIEKETKVRERKIDDVQVLETFSFMTVPHEEAEVILDYFKKRKQGKKALIEVAQN